MRKLQLNPLPSRFCPLLTLALIAVTLCGCSLFGHSDPLEGTAITAAYRAEEQALVEEQITDSARLARVQQLLEERDRLTRDLARAVDSHERQLRQLNADYHAERAAFDAALDEYNQRRQRIQTDMVAVIAALKATTTADEWRAIARFQSKRLNPRDSAQSMREARPREGGA